MNEYKLIKRFYFPDGSYSEPQELRQEGLYYFGTAEGEYPRFDKDFVETNTEFFEKVEEEDSEVTIHVDYAQSEGDYNRYRVIVGEVFKDESKAEEFRNQIEEALSFKKNHKCIEFTDEDRNGLQALNDEFNTDKYLGYVDPSIFSFLNKLTAMMEGESK